MTFSCFHSKNSASRFPVVRFSFPTAVRSMKVTHGDRPDGAFCALQSLTVCCLPQCSAFECDTRRPSDHSHFRVCTCCSPQLNIPSTSSNSLFKVICAFFNKDGRSSAWRFLPVFLLAHCKFLLFHPGCMAIFE